MTAVFTLSLLVCAGARDTRAEELFALTARTAGAPSSIFRFDSANPGAISTPVPVTGLLFGAEDILGVDFRPATGTLYGISNQNRFYSIDPATGVATFIANFTPGTSTIGLGLDFNPVTDQLRAFVRGPEGAPIRRNVRVNPDTGETIRDGDQRYAPGDPNFGFVPNVLGAAYTNNFAGAGTTTLCGIDIGLGVLVRVDPENEGLLNTVGRLGFTPESGLFGTNFIGFDISGVAGAAYLAVTSTGGPTPFVPQFYTVDLQTGAATFAGNIGGGAVPVIGIAAPVGEVIPEPGTLLLLSTGLAGLAVGRHRRRRAGKRAQA
jgi:hypothetical protein